MDNSKKLWTVKKSGDKTRLAICAVVAVLSFSLAVYYSTAITRMMALCFVGGLFLSKVISEMRLFMSPKIFLFEINESEIRWILGRRESGKINITEINAVATNRGRFFSLKFIKQNKDNVFIYMDVFSGVQDEIVKCLQSNFKVY
jgi:hypothetical protein